MLDEESSSPLAVIIIPSLLASSTFLVVILIFYSLHKHKQRRPRTTAQFTSQQIMDFSENSVSSPKVQSVLGQWEMPKECGLEGVEFWQKGHYGPVCKGLLKKKDGSCHPVVIKSLREGPDKPEAKEFVEMLLFYSRVCKHENVAQMWFCQMSRLPLYLILEALSPGSLLHYLWTLRNNNSNDPSQEFSERSVFVLAKQVAAGLDYLMSEHRLVHGDVAARNILIGPGLRARVSGLGGAFRGRQQDSGAVKQRSVEEVKQREVPLKWQAPETIMMQLRIDRSDIWSFGILLYEMITLGSPPYPELEPLSVLPKLQRSYRMKKPENCGASLYDLMKYCWMWSFKDRPAFSAIIKLLDSSLYQASTKPIYVPDPIDIFQYNTIAGLVS